MKKKTGALCAAILAVCMLSLGCGARIPHLSEISALENLEADESVPFAFYVASFNLYGSGMDEQKAEKVSRFLDVKGFDVVGLQEVDKNAPRSGNRDYLGMLESDVYRSGYFAPTYALGEHYGLGILGKNELTHQHAFFLPYPYSTIKENVEERILIRSVARADGGVPVVFYNTHLSFETVEGGAKAHRAKQIAYILGVLAADPNPYKILVGDFNVSSVQELLPFERAGMKIAFREGNTHEEGLLDNIIYSGNLTLQFAEMTDLETSDHLLLQAKFIKE